ncbi:MAG: TIGR01777 family oxidoreductase [Bacteroidetes bacterium]|nr:TIGR01777 family oxidoreductase [Bacteroidota bacterium]
MNILILGGTGLIGSALIPILSKSHTVVVATRRKSLSNINPYIVWSEANPGILQPTIENSNVIINLAGTSIASLWTKKRKKSILQSRLRTTHLLTSILHSASRKPQLLINASAVGYYGSRKGETLTEESSKGAGFLAFVCEKWENEALKATNWGIRVILLRFGIVLSQKGGILSHIFPLMKVLGGFSIGTDNQWMSWININDVVRIIEYSLTASSLSGPVNAVAPYPIEAKQFYLLIARHLGCSRLLRFPPTIISVLFGEMGKELLLTSQYAIPQKLFTIGYRFQFEHFTDALHDILNQYK